MVTSGREAFSWLNDAIRQAGDGRLTVRELAAAVSPSLAVPSAAHLLSHLATVSQWLADEPRDVVDLDERQVCALFGARNGDDRTFWCCLRTEPDSAVISELVFHPAATVPRGEVPAEIRTERLVLRRIDRTADREAFVSHFADPAVMRLFGAGDVFDAGTTDTVLASDARNWLTRGYGIWVERDRPSDRLLGQVGLLYLYDKDAVEIEFTLNPDVWGEGVATEAAARVMTIAFEVIGLERVVAMTHPDNLGSVRVLEKIGMSFERDEPRFGQPRRWFSGRALPERANLGGTRT